ncbi:hypothetical protein A3Q56_04368 [Intoshia linei]|uniref:Uncharacterized protein n=1 Tax=Intoshia linei TaxID=1819745 RepID=A0A177B0U3_9BILA|nr:hypothetical protein A3Q56_04368 [Intoshia linei]
MGNVQNKDEQSNDLIESKQKTILHLKENEITNMESANKKAEKRSSKILIKLIKIDNNESISDYESFNTEEGSKNKKLKKKRMSAKMDGINTVNDVMRDTINENHSKEDAIEKNENVELKKETSNKTEVEIEAEKRFHESNNQKLNCEDDSVYQNITQTDSLQVHANSDAIESTEIPKITNLLKSQDIYDREKIESVSIITDDEYNFRQAPIDSVATISLKDDSMNYRKDYDLHNNENEISTIFSDNSPTIEIYNDQNLDQESEEVSHVKNTSVDQDKSKNVTYSSDDEKPNVELKKHNFYILSDNSKYENMNRDTTSENVALSSNIHFGNRDYDFPSLAKLKKISKNAYSNDMISSGSSDVNSIDTNNTIITNIKIKSHQHIIKSLSKNWNRDIHEMSSLVAMKGDDSDTNS